MPGLPLTRDALPIELNQQKLTNERASWRAPHNGAAVYARPILDVSLCQTARPKGRMHAKSPQWPAPRGPTRSCRLGVLGHVPLSRLVRRRGWPCAGYSGLVNPSSRVFVCWNKISAHECRQSLGRLLGRAAVMVTRYERIERMVPHRVSIFIVADAPKIKAIESSFGDRRKMKRLLRKTDYRGYKIVPSAARPYFSPCFVEFGWSVSQRALPECWLDAIFVLTFESLRRISFALWERLVS
jgi:hypothetical protein